MVPVKCIFNDARRRGDIKDNPTEMIRRFREEKPQIDPLSFPGHPPAAIRTGREIRLPKPRSSSARGE